MGPRCLKTSETSEPRPEANSPPPAGVLAGRLVVAGMAHPRRPRRDDPSASPSLSVTVVVPARDRADALERCLASLGRGQPVVVVDDDNNDGESARRQKH